MLFDLYINYPPNFYIDKFHIQKGPFKVNSELIKVSDRVARQFTVWDVEFSDPMNGDGTNTTVYRQRTTLHLLLVHGRIWITILQVVLEYNTYHVYDSSTDAIIRFTCALSNMGIATSGIREPMIIEEF
jgi:hypothetical protein